MTSETHLYLNDSVINNYFNLIQKQYPSVYCFDTYFYVRLEKSKYKSVERWTKKINIFSKRKVFFPINIRRKRFAHWILITADMDKRRVIYFDSLKNHYEYKIHLDILSYLQQEHERKLGYPLQNWRIVRGSNPQQSNGSDCGVFVCTIAEYLARDASFNFKQKNMPSFRKLILYELFIEQLITVDEDVDEDSIVDEIDRMINNSLMNR
ncbi:sentrin-specific protease 2-like [Metopolophium dirhodum]|uniref:sentrin-specific protease 2-like n=1 Tax=Metopolophium dirhodum TaxID=44670 RepID=UPI00298F4D1E|nr:sentrin-specific protease 2-like [Metopolophium dirhodum]XP_060860215.1 sentrin-specific protease 2-like [Metopolophium dirhodum]